MYFDRKQWSNEALVNIYRKLLLPRLIEEKMLILLRQGKISKWFSGIGQEAIAVGSTFALEADEWIMPLHRNLGVFTGRDMPLLRLFLQWQGSSEGYSKGRERSFHFGSREHHICGMISHLGPQLAIADGTSLAHLLNGKPKVSLAFTGDGGTSEGDFHEALNVAAVWDLPVIFLIENNGYGLSTPVQEQYRCNTLADRAIGYGMKGSTINGNNILNVIEAVSEARDYCLREKKPYLLECVTFRMRGHEEASGIKYVPQELLDKWAKQDPVVQYEHYLLREAVLTTEEIAAIRSELKTYIESELELADKVISRPVDTATELSDVYAPATEITVSPGVLKSRIQTPEVRFIDAIADALYQSMQQHENLVLMGQDIAEYGGAFKITEGLVQEFGRERVRNTPLCESAIIGTALGLSLEGCKSMVEMQFADFVTAGFNQIVNNLAKLYYRWGQAADVVIRMPTGGGVGAGPFHSQSNEAWFVHTPGLKVVYPSSAEDAKGLLIAAINDPGPVLFFEHKALYRSVTGKVAADFYETPIGKARVVKEGSELSIITYGAGVHWAMEYAESRPDVDIEILDLRTLLPLDYEAIKASVLRTGKVLVLHEDTLTGGIGGEIAAWIGEHCFDKLDAPVMRCASLDTPVPFDIRLEQNFMAKSRIALYINKLLLY
ncbi:2-oxoisovalerate dehydrogenase E1 component [Filimonas zeae]|uniref:Dehydrogenase n=1 Tax=Filimonas zeae TaxID=1737353 RepID=A0A917MZK9_9BACT|nr:dehydrogenase E1 component subunit alpha/beta [Filimonas zeae]MDR6342702.1 2-oxoisovalerate dehydrogenase E1 component [Filimonas zeae]GGH82366.1 dehydrogenase [Filimonas zeae]